MKNKLTESETKQLITLLKKVKLPAPYPVFLALSKSVPLVAVNILLMPDEDHILLTYRKDDFYDHWHIPGSILLMNEHPKKAIHRVAKKELGIKVQDFEFINYVTEFSARGHGVMLMFKVEPKNQKPKDGKYFHLDKLPKKFLEEQRGEITILQALRKTKRAE
ncbi:MAG: NUDIX domain-containing protein [bacterium]|nr:NUDIX domain-containing protein [bacterium]